MNVDKNIAFIQMLHIILDVQHWQAHAAEAMAKIEAKLAEAGGADVVEVRVEGLQMLHIILDVQRSLIRHLTEADQMWIESVEALVEGLDKKEQE